MYNKEDTPEKGVPTPNSNFGLLMRIYFNGCSWTWGNELENRDDRFSKLICNRLNAEEVNKSKSGCSNFYIMRTSLEENPQDYDIAIIQLTKRNRTEYYDTKSKRWANVHQSLLRRGSPHHNKPHEDHIDWWTDYYKNIYSSEYGFAYEKLAYTAIKGHWGSTPLIITTINADGESYDLRLEDKKYPRLPKKHPNRIGHWMIANDIMKLI